MHLPLLLTTLFNLLLTRVAVSANSAPALFDNSPRGQHEWSLFCSSTAQTSKNQPPFACFTMYDDITAAAHSSTQQELGFASASGQDFVVVAPKTGEDSKVEFYASGFWFQIAFSEVTRCAKVDVWAPIRAKARTRDGEETALEPFMQVVSCQIDHQTKPEIFRVVM